MKLPEEIIVEKLRTGEIDNEIAIKQLRSLVQNLQQTSTNRKSR